MGGAVLALIIGIGLAPLALGVAADFGVDGVCGLARALGFGFAAVLTGLGGADPLARPVATGRERLLAVRADPGLHACPYGRL